MSEFEQKKHDISVRIVERIVSDPKFRASIVNMHFIPPYHRVIVKLLRSKLALATLISSSVFILFAAFFSPSSFAATSMQQHSVGIQTPYGFFPADGKVHKVITKAFTCAKHITCYGVYEYKAVYTKKPLPSTATQKPLSSTILPMDPIGSYNPGTIYSYNKYTEDYITGGVMFAAELDASDYYNFNTVTNNWVHAYFYSNNSDWGSTSISQGTYYEANNAREHDYGDFYLVESLPSTVMKKYPSM